MSTVIGCHTILKHIKRRGATVAKPPIVEKPVNISMKIEPKLHADLKECANLDRRSMSSFIIQTLADRIEIMLYDHPNNSDYVPLGLRRNP